MKLNFESAEPLYIQLFEKLQKEILNNSLTTGKKLPTEQTLSKQFNVSRVTVRKALEELEQNGLIIKVQGKGTFINSPKITKRLNNKAIGFSEMIRNQGMEPKAKTIRSELIKPDNEDIKIFGLKKNEKIYNLDRLRMANSIPVSYEISRFSPKYSFLKDENLNGKVSLFSLLQEKYKVSLINSSKSLDIVFCTDPEIVEALNITIGYPLLYIHGIVYDEQNIPVYRSFIYFRGDKFSFTI
ncbi:MAG: GntR family transcriptional regulator [Pleomorphochaeta sp.]